MATAIDVMKYIKAKKRLTGEVQLQKLVYYSQAWSLAWDGAPLFHDKIEAWRHGPVCRSIYKRTDTADATALTPQERATVDAVLTYYGTMPGATLSQMSHEEKPWADVWGDRRSDETCSDEITHDAMRRFYTIKALNGHGPRRVPEHVAAEDAELREIAAANVERWRETLAILAQ